MSSSAIQATHIPTGEVTHYGPWPDDPDDPVKVAVMATFYHGFACGWHAHAHPDGSPEDLSIEVIEVPDEEDESTEFPVGVTAFASGSVTHPEGT